MVRYIHLVFLSVRSFKMKLARDWIGGIPEQWSVVLWSLGFFLSGCWLASLAGSKGLPCRLPALPKWKL